MITLEQWFELFLKINKIDNIEDNEGAYLLEGQIKERSYLGGEDEDVRCYTLPEFSKLDYFIDFVYDRSTKMVLTDFKYAFICHETFCSAITLALNETNEEFKKYTIDKNVEVFVDKHGFYQSSVSSRVYITQKTKLTGDEKIAFKKINFIRD